MDMKSAKQMDMEMGNGDGNPNMTLARGTNFSKTGTRGPGNSICAGGWWVGVLVCWLVGWWVGWWAGGGGGAKSITSGAAMMSRNEPSYRYGRNTPRASLRNAFCNASYGNSRDTQRRRDRYVRRMVSGKI